MQYKDIKNISLTGVIAKSLTKISYRTITVAELIEPIVKKVIEELGDRKLPEPENKREKIDLNLVPKKVRPTQEEAKKHLEFLCSGRVNSQAELLLEFIYGKDK